MQVNNRRAYLGEEKGMRTVGVGVGVGVFHMPKRRAAKEEWPEGFWKEASFRCAVSGKRHNYTHMHN